MVYVVEVYDESNQLVHTETLSNNTGTINYKPTGNVRVVGYYKYAELEVTSNKVERTINVNTSQLDDVSYTITSNGSTVSNGSTISGTSIAINVHAQNESNTITIQFLSSTGESILDPITFTGSATREFTLDSGFTYTVRVTESNGTNSVNRSTTFTVSG